MAHPLSENPQWRFWQPFVGVKATVLRLDKEGKAEVLPLSANSTCREGVLNNLRTRLWQLCMVEKTISGWKRSVKRPYRVRLFDERLLEDLPGANSVIIDVRSLRKQPTNEAEAVPEERVAELLEVADALVGIPGVLLSHRRPTGEWWRTSTTEIEANYVRWQATDNWFMRHPALVSIATGLLRQAALLVANGFGPQILERVDRKHVEESLTTGDWRLAYGLAKQLRPWIEVPPASNSHQRNYAFPSGMWPRFDRLQRAQRRHNYQKIFGESFYESWNLRPEGTGAQWSGVYSFWGEDGALTEAGRRLMELGKPRRRAKGVQAKPAS